MNLIRIKKAFFVKYASRYQTRNFHDTNVDSITLSRQAFLRNLEFPLSNNASNTLKDTLICYEYIPRSCVLTIHLTDRKPIPQWRVTVCVRVCISERELTS